MSEGARNIIRQKDEVERKELGVDSGCVFGLWDNIGCKKRNVMKGGKKDK